MNNRLKAVAALAVCGMLVVGGTLALMSDTTDTKTNIFTIGSGVSGEVIEPNWDGKDTGGKVEYTPGSVINKDPQVSNTSDKEAVFAGLKVEYVLSDDAYVAYNAANNTNYKSNTEVLTALNFSDQEDYVKFITSQTPYNKALGTVSAVNPQTEGYWAPMDGVANGYFYTTDGTSTVEITAGMTTEPIFEKVYISNEIGIDKMLPFEMKITGYLVQSANNTTGIDSLRDLMA